MPHNYPLLLDVSDRLIVIVGGGEVAVRKAIGLLDAGAKRVRMIAPRGSAHMPDSVERIYDAYRREHLQSAGLVFAATDDPHVNVHVLRDARAMNILVCRADADEGNSGDFATPAMLRRGPVLVTVSTGGSPALAKMLRATIEGNLDPRFVTMAELMQSLRPRIHAIASLAPSRRKEIFRALATDDALNVLRDRHADGLMQWLKERFPELAELGA
jgi:precorrin-2 dehydrogenase/sirohydrochlorin ferrochelatase